MPKPHLAFACSHLLSEFFRRLRQMRSCWCVWHAYSPAPSSETQPPPGPPRMELAGGCPVSPASQPLSPLCGPLHLACTGPPRLLLFSFPFPSVFPTGWWRSYRRSDRDKPHQQSDKKGKVILQAAMEEAVHMGKEQSRGPRCLGRDTRASRSPFFLEATLSQGSVWVGLEW